MKQALVFCALGFLPGVPGRAQTLITSITTSTSDVADTVNEVGAPGSPSGYTFQGTTTAITSFNTAAQSYTVTGLADAAYVRRNSSGSDANQSSAWYVNGSNFIAPHADTYAQLLLGNDINRGSDNTFANGTDVTMGNIERLDFVFTSGIKASAGLAFTVFDRGLTGVHDGFGIAAITGWDSVNHVPTSYALLTGQAGNWGPTNVADTFNYTLFRYSNGDNLTSNNVSTETNSQGIGGVLFTAADLGLTPGTTIYGYSLFGYDVTDAGNTANLIDWTNATYFPTNTDATTGGGGIDLAALNGISFSVVPEPSAYALAAVGVLAGFIGWRHRPRRAAARGSLAPE